MKGSDGAEQQFISIATNEPRTPWSESHEQKDSRF